MTTAVLIDADTLVYQAAWSAEDSIQWDESLFTNTAELSEGIEKFDHLVKTFQEGLSADLVVLALSNYDRPWRKELDRQYKAQRDKAVRKPLLRDPLRAYIHERSGEAWEVFERPTLEGDDVLGILMTSRRIRAGRKVCVSIDKDLKTVPGLHLNYTAALERPDHMESLIFEVTEEEADRWHLLQTLAGDPTDEYPGCPGVGMKRAARFLDEGRVFEKVEHTFKSGPRKGQTETRWIQGREGAPWEIIVSLFESKGLTEEDALRNARVARICRASDYDFKTKEVRLWTPTPSGRPDHVGP